MRLRKKMGKTHDSVRTHIDLSKPSSHSGPIILEDCGHVDISSRNSFVSIHTRPLAPNLLHFPHRLPNNIESTTSVVVQGPMILDHDFTFNTLRMYRHLFSSSPIVLSTWSDTPLDLLKAAESLGCHVIVSEKPIEAGWGNINLQVTSTSAGVEFASSLGSSHVIKTRTDFRIHRGEAITNLLSLIDAFPVTHAENQQQRIIGTDLATLKHRVYGLTDIFQFGNINDMLAYWDKSSYEDSVTRNFGLIDLPPIIDGTPLVSEIYLCWRFLSGCGEVLDFTLENWWTQLRNRFSIVDLTSLDGFWFKHDWHWEYRFGNSYTQRGPLSVSQLDWLTLYEHGIPESWTSSGFKERWIRGIDPSGATTNGITQVSV